LPRCRFAHFARKASCRLLEAKLLATRMLVRLRPREHRRTGRPSRPRQSSAVPSGKRRRNKRKKLPLTLLMLSQCDKWEKWPDQSKRSIGYARQSRQLFKSAISDLSRASSFARRHGLIAKTIGFLETGRSSIPKGWRSFFFSHDLPKIEGEPYRVRRRRKRKTLSTMTAIPSGPRRFSRSERTDDTSPEERLVRLRAILENRNRLRDDFHRGDPDWKTSFDSESDD